MKNSSILLIVLLILLSAFRIGESKKKDKVIGTWEYDAYKGNSSTYIKVKTLSHKAPGYQLLKNGKLIVLQNGGWCGTPPISYKEYTGSWERISDSTLTVSYGYWGGTLEGTWLVKRISKSLLSIQADVSAIKKEE